MVTNTSQEPFVKRFEYAIMQYVILNKAQQGEVTRENLQNVFKGNLQMSQDHLQHCIQQLVQDGHLKENGNKYTVTDDGREDVQKLQHLVMELPQIVNQGGQQQRQGMQAQRATGGGIGSTGGTQGGNVGGQGGMGGQGNVGGAGGQNRNMGNR